MKLMWKLNSTFGKSKGWLKVQLGKQNQWVQLLYFSIWQDSLNILVQEKTKTFRRCWTTGVLHSTWVLWHRWLFSDIPAVCIALMELITVRRWTCIQCSWMHSSAEQQQQMYQGQGHMHNPNFNLPMLVFLVICCWRYYWAFRGKKS